MALKVDLRQFIDEAGHVLALTAQAKIVFKFITKIVSSVSKNTVSKSTISKHIEQSLIDVDLKCNTRAEELSCDGDIEAICIEFGMIEWHCDTCEAAGTISHWQGSMWDKQTHILH